MKKIIFTAILTLGLLLPASLPAIAVSGSVNVTLPSFEVTLNGTEIDNDYSQYPLIIYNDITYFPMTYYDCRFLGLKTGWEDAQRGLFIDTTGIQGSYNPYTQKSKNAKSAKAQIAAFPITVNGKAIDNAKEEYPLLLFRNVTYFPMTWRFCVDEFNWQYSFSTQDGLIISSSYAIRQYDSLPGRAVSDNPNDAATDGEYVYYAADAGRIMSTPLNDIAHAKEVFQLPIDDFLGDYYCRPTIFERDGKVFLSYHLGGASMGSSYLYLLEGTNEARKLDSSTSKILLLADKQFRLHLGSMPGSMNLFMMVDDQWQSLGDENYIYGYNWSILPSGNGSGTPTDCFYYDSGEYLYTLGFNLAKAQDPAEKNGIFRINISTNENLRITPADLQIAYFTADDSYIYYCDDFNFYRYDLKTSDHELFCTFSSDGQKVESFAALNGSLFVKTSDNSAFSKLWLIEANGEFHFLDNTSYIADFAVKDGYLVAVCKAVAETAPRLLVFNEKGSIAFQSYDGCNLSSVAIKNKTIYYYNLTTQKVCSSKLPF